MRTFMTLFAAGLMFATTTSAFGYGNLMGSRGYAYTTPGARSVMRFVPTYHAPAPVEGRRSLSIEPGTAPTVAPAAVVAPTYRVTRPHPPTWLLPKSDPHRYVTGF